MNQNYYPRLLASLLATIGLALGAARSPVYGSPDDAKAGRAVKQIGTSITELSKAKRLESGLIGEGGKSKLFEAYAQLQKLIGSVSMQDLMWLRSNSTPAGRVYGVLLTRAKDPAQGNHAILELLDDDTPLEYLSGCEVLKSSVSEIGRALVATGKYLDLQNSAQVKPLYVSELAHAKVFADEVGGESGRSLEYLVFDAARQNVRALRSADLQEVIAKGSPAGKLYAAILLATITQTEKSKAYAPLLNDSAKVTYLSGCKVADYEVREIAKQLQQTGRFHNFATD